jgi:hypothetical protein
MNNDTTTYEKVGKILAHPADASGPRLLITAMARESH